MVSVCTVPARGGRSCEGFGGYKTINRIPLPLSKNHSNIASAPPFERIPFQKYQYAIRIFKMLSHLSITILTYLSITFLLNRLCFSVMIRLKHVYTQID